MAAPWCSTSTRVASDITARMTCSISRMVRPPALSSLRISTIRSVSVGRSPAITSSSNRSFGSVARARATSRRLRSGSVSEPASCSRLSWSSSRRSTSCARCIACLGSLCRSSAPTMTLSSTVSAGNGRTIWNVRPMPRRQTSSGVRPSMRWPWNAIVPVFGANTPAIRLNIVVLPAPFGPITAKIAPSGTAKLTSATARSPLKFLETPATSSIKAMSRLRLLALAEAQQAGERRPDAMRQRHDNHQQADAVEHAFDARNIETVGAQKLLKTFGKTSDQEGADHRTEQRADAADDRAEDDLDRAQNEERLLGKQVVVVERIEHAGRRCHAG